jgi:hypothetical protein
MALWEKHSVWRLYFHQISMRVRTAVDAGDETEEGGAISGVAELSSSVPSALSPSPSSVVIGGGWSSRLVSASKVLE